MTDADVDGSHIASLLLTFFLQSMPKLLENGNIFLAQPPLYRISHPSKTIYAHNDFEKDHLIKTQFPKNAKVEISRFKGLGEMPVDQLRKTTMDAKSRNLLRVTINGNPNNCEHYNDFVKNLMGKNPEARFNFIQENAQFAKDLDV
jgi:topoisomerase-4 subunit B